MNDDYEEKIQRLYWKRINENKHDDTASSLELLLLVFIVVVLVFLSANVNWF